MALSGSFNRSATGAQIVQRALEDIGVVVAGESVDSDDQSVALERLNDIAKQWSVPSDSSPGLKVWLRKYIYLFLQKDQRTYDIGPTGTDKCTLSYSRTTISAAEAAGQTVISVTGTAISNNDIIGIVMDSGSIHWSTVASGGGTATPTIALALTGAAAAGNSIYYWGSSNSVVFMPNEILTAVLRDTSTSDTPLVVCSRETFKDFEAEVSKTTTTDPVAVLYEPKRINGTITLAQAAGNVDKVLRMYALSPADDIDASSDEVAFPQVWFPALEWETAKRCASVFEKPWTPERQANWEQATGIARGLNPSGYMGGYIGGQDPNESDPSL